MSGFGVEISSRISGAGGGNTIERLQQTPLKSDDKDEKSFGNLLKNMVNDVKDTQQTSNNAMEELVAGRSKDIHGAMIAMEKADVSLRLLMQVRNKVIEAYREVMRMQV
jgi:flagellar hook-basal body complex protein FliE